MEGMDEVAFLRDEKTQSAVIMQLALIGELAKRVSESTRAAIPLPWRQIAGFCDRAIHDYYQIDLQVAWGTLVDDLVPLAEAVAGVPGQVNNNCRSRKAYCPEINRLRSPASTTLTPKSNDATNRNLTVVLTARQKTVQVADYEGRRPSNFCRTNILTKRDQEALSRRSQQGRDRPPP